MKSIKYSNYIKYSNFLNLYFALYERYSIKQNDKKNFKERNGLRGQRYVNMIDFKDTIMYITKSVKETR